MKIIFLNIWMGKVERPLLDFVTKHAKTADVFCFSEVTNGKVSTKLGNLNEHEVGKEYKKIVKNGCPNTFVKIKQSLPGFIGKFRSSNNYTTASGAKVPMGLACFVRKGLVVKESVSIINETEMVPHRFERIMQILEVKKGSKKIWINSLHGISMPGSKLDTKERLLQSKNICRVLRYQRGKKLLGGDFNLMPNTKSVLTIEKQAMNNLIKTFKIRETRSSISHSQYQGRIRQHYADFAFASRDVKVKNFEVPRINISDHLPLILEIEL